MSRLVPYLFCRYSFSIGGDSLSATEQFRHLQVMRGRYVAHRNPDATDDQKDTFIMRPRRFSMNDRAVLSWDVAQQLTGRSETLYDSDKDDVEEKWVASEGVKFTTLVAIPRLGVLAVSDRAGDQHLGATSAIARFRSILKHALPDADVEITAAANRQDVETALARWQIERFDFVLRPFNPHPRKPGETLSELFARDGIGRFQGKAVPTEGGKIRPQEGGYVEEAVGLADAGYGQYGIQGKTPEGREAALKRPNFDPDRTKNERNQAAPQQLRVKVEPQDSREAEIREVAAALFDFYAEE